MKLRGKAFFTWANKPNPGLPERKISPSYQITLALEGDEVKKAQKEGLRLSAPTEKIPYFHYKFTSYVRNESDLENRKFRVVDAEKKDYNGPIWNESVVNVVYSTMPNGRGDDRKGLVNIIQVLELASPPEGYIESKALEELDDNLGDLP